MTKKILKYMLVIAYCPIYWASYVVYWFARLILAIAYLGLLLPRVSRDIFISLFTTDFTVMYERRDNGKG